MYLWKPKESAIYLNSKKKQNIETIFQLTSSQGTLDLDQMTNARLISQEHSRYPCHLQITGVAQK